MRACCGSIAAVALSFVLISACSDDEDKRHRRELGQRRCVR